MLCFPFIVYKELNFWGLLSNVNLYMIGLSLDVEVNILFKRGLSYVTGIPSIHLFSIHNYHNAPLHLHIITKIITAYYVQST